MDYFERCGKCGAQLYGTVAFVAGLLVCGMCRLDILYEQHSEEDRLLAEAGLSYTRAVADKDTLDGDGPIRFTASTPGVKRDGLDLDTDAWRLDNYRKNPVVLWAHDYMGRTLPIGKADVFVEKDALLADVTFDREDEFARQVEGKYRRGFLNAVSVGWDTVEEDNERYWDLLDLSSVPVPGDPDALIERQRVGLRGIANALLEMAEEEPASEPDEDRWESVAARMRAVFDPRSDDSDEERKAEYNALLPHYRRLGKVAPEYLPVEQLRAFGEKERRGLFLEDEWDGIDWPLSLTHKRREELQQAMALIQGVLNTADIDDTPEPAPPPEGDGTGDEGAQALAAILDGLKQIETTEV
ncbi:MAG: HK97 family phage prohead protease [Planctomycetota bacterium]